MSQIVIYSGKKIEGEFVSPADKSISQRAVILSAIACGKTRINNILVCSDTRNLISAFKKMGVAIKLFKKKGNNFLEVEGRGLKGLLRPKDNLYLGNSGTALRLITGVLAGQNFRCLLKGDKSLSLRPMKRIIDPLSLMGADIKAKIKKIICTCP